MMRKLGQFMLRSSNQEILVLTLAMVMSLFLSPLSYLISGTPLALLALRKGAVKCMRSAVISLLIFGLAIGMMVPVAKEVVIVFALMIWLPVLIASQTLRATESQAMMLQTCAAMAVLISIGIHTSLGDVEGWWRDYIMALIDVNFQGDEASAIRDVMVTIIPHMNALMMGAVVANIIISVLLARWWQSALFFPGAFKKEFISFRLPIGLLLLLVISLVFSLNESIRLHAMAKDLLVILVVLYGFQGIARVHRSVEEKSKSRFIIIFMYMMIFIMTVQMVVILGLLGVIDSLSDRSKNEPE